jgi:hypothetical protein
MPLSIFLFRPLTSPTLFHITSGITGISTLTSLNMSGNNLGRLAMPEGWKDAGNGREFKNPSGKWLGLADLLAAGAKAEGLIALANAIPDMGALSVLTFGDKFNLYDGKGEQDGVVTIGTSMTSADFSNKNLGVGGAIIVSAWLTHGDNGALSSLNLASNGLCGLHMNGKGTFNASGIPSLSLSHLAHTCLITQVLPLLPMPSAIMGRCLSWISATTPSKPRRRRYCRAHAMRRGSLCVYRRGRGIGSWLTRSSFCVWCADQGTLAPALTSGGTSTTITIRLGY